MVYSQSGMFIWTCYQTCSCTMLPLLLEFLLISLALHLDEKGKPLVFTLTTISDYILLQKNLVILGLNFDGNVFTMFQMIYCYTSCDVLLLWLVFFILRRIKLLHSGQRCGSLIIKQERTLASVYIAWSIKYLKPLGGELRTRTCL